MFVVLAVRPRGDCERQKRADDILSACQRARELRDKLTLPDPVEIDELIALSNSLARAAGNLIREVPGAGQLVATKSSPSDPVTKLDQIVEQYLTNAILGTRPLDGLVLEDSDGQVSTNGVRWVIDALDGSVNHLYGIPHFAVSVAAEVYTGGEWQAVAASVYDPTRDEQFTAGTGRGAVLNSLPLRVNDPVPLENALIATEFSYTTASRRRQAVVVGKVLPAARDIRSTGSSAIDLCWTAAGRFDGFYEDELHRWDWAAGRLVLEESGGMTKDLGSGLVGAGPKLFDELNSLVRASDVGTF